MIMIIKPANAMKRDGTPIASATTTSVDMGAMVEEC